ncbi:hypothetical protein ACAN107058_11205 [Paracidovorax anthurii]|uniref:Uncharacterized protein n=2 Tax=Paracidovorax anthurii TaxID=78229 RepID=A0A328ZKY5_9BURK|nr:hypothetical protein AX018_1001168 [Paracidovorax anthurii]
MTLNVSTPASARRATMPPPEHGSASSASTGEVSPRGSARHADHALAGSPRGRSASIDSPAARARSASPQRTAPHAPSLRPAQERVRNLLKATAEEQLQQAEAMTAAQRTEVETEVATHLKGGTSVEPQKAMALWTAVQTARLGSEAMIEVPAGWARSEVAKGIDNLMQAMTDPMLDGELRKTAADELGKHFGEKGPGPFLGAMGYTIQLGEVPPSELAFAAQVRTAIADTNDEATVVAQIDDALKKHGAPEQLLPLLGAGAASSEEANATFMKYMTALQAI